MDELSPVRQENETFDAYRERLKAIKLTTKLYKRGVMVPFLVHLKIQAYEAVQRRNNKRSK